MTFAPLNKVAVRVHRLSDEKPKVLTGFVIVKHADENYWEQYFHYNPVMFGVKQTLSTHTSYSGEVCKLKASYDTQEAAKKDLEKIRKMNPSGGYAICPIKN